MALGKNQKKMLDFAKRVNGWHTFNRDSKTIRTAKSLERDGLIEVIWWEMGHPQFRITQTH